MADKRQTLLVLSPPSGALLERLRAGTTQVDVVLGSDPSSFERAADGATIMLSWMPSRDLLRRVLLMAPGLRWIHSAWAGINHIVSPELTASPAVLTNGRGVFSASLGEWTLGAMLYFAKDFRRLVRDQMQARWDPYEVDEITGKTVGIVGYGDIGREIAVRARAMGMRVLGVTRRGPAPDRWDGLAEQIFAPADRISMIEQSDYVVVAAPLTPETRGLVGEAEIAAMRSDAVLINIGRGPIVDEAALIRALSEKKIKGAALDVFDREPLLSDSPFYRLENVLLSPHCADRTPGWLEGAMQLFLDNLGRYLRDEPLENVVDKTLGY